MRRDYIPTGSIIHQLDPRVKFFGFLMLTLICVLWEDPLLLLGLIVVQGIITRMARLPLKLLWAALAPGLPILILIFILNFFLYQEPEGSLFLGYAWPAMFGHGPGLPVYLETLVFSIALVFRFSVILTAAMLLTVCTAPTEMALGFVRLGAPAEFGMAISTAISYIPVLFSQITGVLEAQQARGWKGASTKNPLKRVASYFPVLIPTLFRSVASAELMAAALLSRGFGYDLKRRTYLRATKFGRKDVIGTLMVAGALAVGFAVFFMGLTEFTLTVNLIKGL
ncbi:MAG: energy-coupling factor transporter transmembrane protein EcfT [Bacillota bacterium]|nr:MAG: energy-coupling factor transporter transmembrane protein EcfT [Bacillota bacterium]